MFENSENLSGAEQLKTYSPKTQTEVLIDSTIEGIKACYIIGVSVQFPILNIKQCLLNAFKLKDSDNIGQLSKTSIHT